MRRPGKRAQGQVGVGGGDPARSRLDRLRREIERCSLAYSS